MSGERVDLLARRQARREANGDARIFTFGAMEYEGPAELPLTFVDLLRVGQFTEAIRTLFGERTAEFMRVVQPTLDDLMVIAEVYGASLPSLSTSTDS